jgi:predicted Fe-Mo cluster-binding NifX family protein
MKICVPTRNDGGLDAETYGHVGGAPYYTVADTDSGQVRTFPRGRHAHAPEECGPGARIRSLGADTVVCNDIGRRAMAALEGAGITVLFSEGKTVREILEAAVAGSLRTLTADDVCAGHGAHHGLCGASADRHGRHRPPRERSGTAAP